MRLTDEQVIEYMYRNGHFSLPVADYITKRLKENEQLRQINEQLRSDNMNAEMNLSHMTDLYEQLQARNGAMRDAVEVLETVTEHLENCYGRNTPDTEKAKEAIAAIDKIGGKEDE